MPKRNREGKKWSFRFEFNREPGGTRTPNLLIRSQVHYPIMLQVLFGVQNYNIYSNEGKRVNGKWLNGDCLMTTD